MTAANPLRGEASFEVDGKTFTLAYDINAMILAEDAAGVDMDQLITKLESGKNIKALRAAIWAGLQRYHPETSTGGGIHLLRAGEMLVEVGVAEIRIPMLKAIKGAFPPAEPEANPPKAAGGTGSDGTAAVAPKA